MSRVRIREEQISNQEGFYKAYHGGRSPSPQRNQVKRDEEMAYSMKKLAELGGKLSEEQRNNLSVAYNNLVEYRRSSWKDISSIEQRSENSAGKQHTIKERKNVEEKIFEICIDFLTLVDNFILPNARTAESKVYYLTMKGDYYRYMAEVASGDERRLVVEKSQQSYQEASDIAKDQIQPTHPTRLRLCLNFSVFCYEILNDQNKASELAKQASVDAVPGLDSLDETSTAILKTINENASSWLPNAAIDDVNANEPNE